MAKRAVKTAAEAEQVPSDQSIMIDVSALEDEQKLKDLQQAPEGEVKTPPEAPPLTPEEPKAEDDSSALRKQLDELNKAQKANIDREVAKAVQRERETFEQQNRQASTDREHQYRARELQSNYDTVQSYIAQANAEVDSAAQQKQAARDSGDIRAEIDADKALAGAISRVTQLERDKYSYEAQLEEAKKPPPAPAQDTSVEARIASVPNAQAREWLQAHRDYVTDPTKHRHLVNLHNVAEDKGLTISGPGYWDFIEEGLGLRTAQSGTEGKADDDEDDPPQRQRAVVSAPPSKDSTSMSTGRPVTKVTLSADERDIARKAGISELEYAKNKIELQRRKSSGHYER